MNEHIVNFEKWLSESLESISLNKTMDGSYPVYENKFTLALFGAYLKGIQDESQNCCDVIRNNICEGHLQGDGRDKTAERNGLVLASNIIMERIENNEDPRN